MDKVNEFLAKGQKVFLLLGDSGAGKSTFNRELECQLWESYKQGGAIPLHINLPAIDKPEHDMIAKQLRRAEFTELQIRELKARRTFILICDGYDESQQTRNLYISNRLNQTGEWSAKMLISCRSEYIGSDYRDQFQPGDRNHPSEPSLFQEAVITPFSVSQIQEYITQYVSVHRPLWKADEYKRALGLIPSLKELVRNPFLMSLSLEVLPRMVDPGQDLSATHITRVTLYDQFIEHWFERGKKRLGEKNMGPLARAAFEGLVYEGFTRSGIDYLKRLSEAIYKEQDGQSIVRYSRYSDEGSWKTKFFSREDENQLLREACPLIRSGNQYRFIHRSLLEYGVALAAFDPRDWKERMASESSLARRSDDSNLDEHNLQEEMTATVQCEKNLNSPLAWRSFTGEPSVLQFLEERVHQEPLFKQQLLGYIEHSKSDKKYRTAASNGITILVRSGMQFNGADLRGIRIPRADLSNGMFDSAQLQGADLRHVDLRGVWLKRANLSGSDMTGVQLGETPYLVYESEVNQCFYSPDGRSIAVVLNNGEIHVHAASTWELLWTVDDFSGVSATITYSPRGDQLAFGSTDNAIRIWSIETGECRHILYGHSSNKVTCVAYSPHGDRVASASKDTTVKLWDMETGDCRTLVGHTSHVSCVRFSPDGNQIASCSDDCSIRLWDTATGECSRILLGHSELVKAIVYSPQGYQLVSVDTDGAARLWDVATGDCRLDFSENEFDSIVYSPKGNQVASFHLSSLRLWDVEQGDCLHVLNGHSYKVTELAYSPRGDLVASSSIDTTLRIWDTESGVCLRILTGHSGFINSVVFSPKGDRIISGGRDKVVRLWDVEVRTSRGTSSGHSVWVNMVTCSPNRHQVASCSDDMTVRLWDIETGECRHILRGHSSVVRCVVFSPQGDQIATCGRTTVRIWNVRTGSCSHTLTGHSRWINRVAYSPQGHQLASCSNDHTVRLWDPQSGECRRTLTGHAASVIWVVYSPKGSQIATCGWDAVRLWDIETGECSFALSGHGGWVIKAFYSPRGDQVASFSMGGVVKSWDTATGDCRLTLTGHKNDIHSATYSPSGAHVASGDWHGAIMLWDAETGTCLQTLDGHKSSVTSIVYSPQGDLVVSANNDKSVRFWDTTSGQCRAVIQDFQDWVNDIAWVETPNANYIVAGCSDGVVGMWKVIVDGDSCQVRVHWRTTNGELAVKDTVIQDVQGLSPLNTRILKQCGALGEPGSRLREASKKVATMTSVVSKLRPLSNGTEDLALGACLSVGQLQQRVEQAKDPLFRDLVAFVRDMHASK